MIYVCSVCHVGAGQRETSKADDGGKEWAAFRVPTFAAKSCVLFLLGRVCLWTPGFGCANALRDVCFCCSAQGWDTPFDQLIGC